MKISLITEILPILILVSLFRSSVSKTSNAQVKSPGLFYVFVSGQVILIDAVENKTVKAIRAFEKTGIPFPNQCSGNPFNGTWNDQTLGIGHHTIFMSASYLATGSDRLSGLTDALYIVDTKVQEITERVPLLDRPVHTYYIPFENSVWTHNDGVGTFTVVRASYPYDVIEENTTSPRIVVGHGKLIYDERLGSKGFKTTVSRPGVYVMDISNPDNSAKSVEYLDFNEMLTSDQVNTCGGTHGIGYSSINNQVYIGCIPKSSIAPGTVAISGETNGLVKFWNFTSSQLYTTPDQTFVIGTDGKMDRLNLLYITPNDTQHLTVQLKTNSTPSYLVIYPKGDYYWAFVSLLNAPEVAIVDFNGIMICAVAGNCTTSVISKYVTYYTVGYHNPPDAPSSIAKYRPIDAGHRFVCTSARYENAVYCYDTESTTVNKYEGFEHLQRLVFVQGELNGDAEDVNTKYDCSTAPTTISKVSSNSSGVSKLSLGTLSFFFVIFNILLQNF